MLCLLRRSRHFSLSGLTIFCSLFILLGTQIGITTSNDSRNVKHAVLRDLDESETGEECIVESGQLWRCSILHKRLVQMGQLEGDVERRVTSPASSFLDKMMLSSNLSSNWSSQFDLDQLSSGQRKNRITKFDMYYFVQVDPHGHPPGEIYIGPRLYWNFQPANADVNSYYFRILIWPVGNESRTLSMQVKLWRDNLTSVIPQRHTIKSYIYLYNRPPLSKPFAFGRSYNLKVEMMKEETASEDFSGALAEIASEDGENAAASLTMEFPPSYASSDNSKCKLPALSFPNPKEVWMRKRMASRWKSTFDQLKFHEFQPSVTVTFFAALPSYCIEQYLLELRLQNALTLDQKYVTVDELESPHPGSISPIGRVTFHNLQKNANYTVRVTPIAMTADGQCVCEYNRNHHCDCVYVTSPMFTYLGFGAVIATKYKETNLDEDVLLTTKEVAYTGESAWLYVVMAMSFLILTLVLLSLALLLRLLRNTAVVRKRNLLLVYNNNRSSGQSEGSTKPLIQSCQSILLVSLEPRHAPSVDYIAKTLEAAGIKVYYCRWEQDCIEQNMQLWVHQVLTQADKIILFHEERALQLLSDKNRQVIEENVFDDVLHAIHSNLVYTDPRIIHVKWCAEQRSLFCRPENVFLLPRDLKLIFSSLRLSVKPDQAKCYQDELAAITATLPSKHYTSTLNDGHIFEKELNESPLIMVHEEGVEQQSNNTECEQIDEYGSDSGMVSNSISGELPIQEIGQNGSTTASDRNATPLYISALQINNKDTKNEKDMIVMTHLEGDMVNHTEDSGIVA